MQNAMAINEDRQDFSYFSGVKFGSEGTNLWMLIDTGAANTWVMGSQCTTSACNTHDTFGTTDSETLNTTTSPWTVSYGTGTVSGVLASDMVALANYSIDLGFGLATTTSDDFNNYPMDGILGLGRPDSNKLDTPSLMSLMASQELLQSNILGIHLQRAGDGATDGQITFGAVDNAKFTSPLSYTNTVTAGGLWEIPVGDAAVGSSSAKMTGKTAVVDTGTSYILMPPLDAATFHALFQGSTGSGANYMIPCSTTAMISFTFSGVAYQVPPKDYLGKADSTGKMCASNIIGQQAFGANQWILGDVFLKNVYTVFDFDENRIGEPLSSDPLWDAPANQTFPRLRCQIQHILIDRSPAIISKYICPLQYTHHKHTPAPLIHPIPTKKLTIWHRNLRPDKHRHRQYGDHPLSVSGIRRGFELRQRGRQPAELHGRRKLPTPSFRRSFQRYGFRNLGGLYLIWGLERWALQHLLLHRIALRR
jgi:hypothetical protein